MYGRVNTPPPPNHRVPLREKVPAHKQITDNRIISYSAGDSKKQYIFVTLKIRNISRLKLKM